MNKDKNTYTTNFILLILGRAVSGLGVSMFGFGLGLYVLDITGSAVIFSLIIGLTILPAVLVYLILGVFVDRYNKKWIMVFSDIISGIIVLIFLFFFIIQPENILIFIVFSLIIGFAQSLFVLAINSSIPNFVNVESVPKVNSAFQIINALINICGPILGAIIYKTIGLKYLFIINATAFIISGLSEIFLLYFSVIKKEFDKNSYFDEIKIAYKYIFKNLILAFFFIFAVIINFMHIPLLLVVVPYINYNLIKITGFQLSVVQASGALGAIIGGVFISLNKYFHKIIIKKIFIFSIVQAVLIILWIFPIFPFFQSENNWRITFVFSFILILFGAINTIQIIPMISYFQIKIPEELRGKVFGVFMSSLYVSTPLGIWLYGVLLENINWISVIVISGLAYIIVSLFAGKNKIFHDFVKQQME